MAKINYDEHIENFPDAFAKSKDSNNYKLLQINAETSEIIREDLKHLSAITDIENASGAVLDHIFGSRVNLKRGGAVNDYQYKVLLKCKMMQNTTDGSHPKMLEALAYALQCEPTEIHIIPSQVSNSVLIKNIPMETISRASFTVEQILDMVNKLLPVNVGVSEYNFDGTFELGEDESDYDENTGLADDAETIGGYFGLLSKGE